MPVVDESTIWNGFYAGLNAGYSWGRPYDEAGDTIDTIEFSGADVAYDDVDGLLGGVQVGYNYDLGGFVCGVEADIQATNASQTVDTGADDLTIEQGYRGTVRGRVGATFGDSLAYVTGGLAYGNGRVSIGAAEEENMHAGCTVGAGLEHAFSDSISLKGEYLYTDLGDEDYSGVLAPWTASDNLGFQSHTIRAGVNFHF